MNKFDIKEVVKKAKAKPKRIKVSFTFDKDVYERFQNTCEAHNVAMSRVLEELMIQFK